MNSFTLKLQDATHGEEIGNVISFVGEDDSGSFGILAGHARFMTTLKTGLARFCSSDHRWRFLAQPGAALYFQDGVLTLSTRRYLIDDDYDRISRTLRQQLMVEESRLQEMKQSLRRMEEEIFRRLWEIGRKGTG
jgi:F-type H+-transporting ATPase subunit epsilon